MAKFGNFHQHWTHCYRFNFDYFSIYQNLYDASSHYCSNLTPKSSLSRAFFLIPTTTTAPPPPVHTMDDDFIVEHLLYSLISSSFFTLLLLIYSRLTRPSHCPSFDLEISNNTQSVLISPFQVPNYPRFYHCQAGTAFSNLRVEGILFPKFAWNKGFLKMTHILDQSCPTIPQ